jgi:tRNA threonylcarbamoyl adenosine modification protein (Sua5/YciO/YrdC/YwlC family)
VVEPSWLEPVVAALMGGRVVVLPTDTVYGLVARAADLAATAALFRTKGRTADVPIAVLCADAAQALELVDPSADRGLAAVAGAWWPGPLTLVAPRRPGLGLELGEPATTIGVRVPADDGIRALAARVGPLAATSANRHGRPPVTTATEARTEFGDVAVVVDGGERAGVASTVLDTTAWPWAVLRAGALDSHDVLATARSARDAE